MIRLVKFAWEKVRAGLMLFGKVNSLVILSLFYFLILGVVAVLMKIVGVFGKKGEDKGKSYWMPREQTEDSEEALLRQF